MDDYFLSEYDFRSMVIDEAHRLKNPKRYLICPLVCVCVCPHKEPGTVSTKPRWHSSRAGYSVQGPDFPNSSWSGM